MQIKRSQNESKSGGRERERSVRETEIKISRAPTSFAVWEVNSATRRDTVCEPSPSPGIIYISAKWGLYRGLVLHVPITRHYKSDPQGGRVVKVCEN